MRVDRGILGGVIYMTGACVVLTRVPLPPRIPETAPSRWSRTAVDVLGYLEMLKLAI